MRARILVIEDEQFLNYTLILILTHAGYLVASATSGTSGLLALQKDHFDLVILDLKLGDINGLDLLSQIRASSQDIKVVIQSADSSEESIRKAYQAGAQAYLIKPSKPEDVLKTVNELLQNPPPS